MLKLLKKFVRILIPVGILGASIVGFGLLKVDEEQVEPPVQEQRAWLVNTQTIQKAVIKPSVQLYGRVEAPTFSTLTAIVEGEVVEVNIRAGQSVKAGDVLIRLDSRTLKTQLLQSEADLNRSSASIAREAQRLTTDQEILQHEKRLLELAVESMKRARTLKSRNLISQAEFDTFERAEQQAHLAVTAREASIREYDSRVAVLEADSQRTEALLDRIRLDLEDAIITAPYDGRVTEVQVALGNQVKNGTPLLSMYDHNNLEVRAMIPNRHLAEIRKSVSDGYKPQATAQIDEHELTLQFDRLASVIDQGRGGVDAYFRLVSNPVRPELSRSVDLELTMASVDDAIMVPYQAIYGLDQVFKIESEYLKSVTIRHHGQIFHDKVAFVVATSDQLVDGDLLVTSQLTNAVDGLRVQPIQSD